MTSFRFYRIAMACCLGLLFINLPFSIGQDISNAPVIKSDAEADFIKPFRVSVNVSEVRLDVVVVDNKGRPITDLTAADFEVYQDKQPQEVTSSFYVNDQTAAATSPDASQRNAPNLPPLAFSGTELKEDDDVRRTIVFVVDNLAMNSEDMHFAKMSLKRFLERQVQPGDLVSIMCTGYGNSVHDMFLSDKRELNARIDGLRIELAMEDRIYGSQEIALSYAIRTMKDMPGRKIIFLVTPEPTINNPFDNFTTPTGDGMSELTKNSDRPLMNYFELHGARFNRLADEAMRAGVVVHLLDVTGLCVPDDSNPECAARLKKMRENPWNPLPVKTGGIILVNENYFLDGIGDYANNMIAGYYLVSYVPPPGTFDRSDYRRVSIKVKRHGAVVHTREGFYSRTEDEVGSAAQAAHPLQNAIFSPFRHADLNVNMTAGFVKGPKDDYILKGSVAHAIKYPDYFIRSWIHLDAKNLKMIETEDGARIELETLCITSGINVAANDQDIRLAKYIFDIKPENITWVQEHGIRFSLLLPVKKPGAYTVRVAVQDKDSGKTGTAHQFLEIPDIKKSGMELSSIFMITSADDLAWMRSNMMKEINELTFIPVLIKDESRSPALRSYAQGDSLQTLAMLYNADKKAIGRSEIEVQSILYKDGEEFLRSKPGQITRDTVDNPDSISLFQRLSIGTNIPPGNYTLQLLVTDKKYSEKRDENGGVFSEKEGLFSRIARAYLGADKNYNRKGVAFQTLNFTVTEK